MKPLFVLTGAFIVSLAALFLLRGHWDYITAGNIAMSAMLLFTAIGHFVLREPMARMLPPAFPLRMQTVLATGFLEVLGAIGLLSPVTRTLTAWLLVLFFILILPANIYAAIHKISYEKAGVEGPGLRYLWFRIPLQLFFIAWVVFFGIGCCA